MKSKTKATSKPVQGAPLHGTNSSGHLFEKDDQGIVRCMHCGQTAENFQRRKERKKRIRCVILDHYQVLEPSENDQFALFYWGTGATRFFVTREQSIKFLEAQKTPHRWIGPFPIHALRRQPYIGPDFPRFKEWIESRGPRRRADTVGSEEALRETIAVCGQPDIYSLIDNYLRTGWTAFEDAANKEVGHVIGGKAQLEPYQSLLAAGADFDEVIRSNALGPAEASILFGSVQLYSHFAEFAEIQLALLVNDESAIERSLDWFFRDCHDYASTLRDTFGAMNAYGPEFETGGQRIKRLRGEAGWSQMNLANEIGTDDPKAIRRYEQGKHVPGPDARYRLAKAFSAKLGRHITPEELKS